MALPDDIVTSVAASSFKTLAESSAFAMGLSYQDSVDAQRNSRTVSNAATANAVRQLLQANIQEIVAESKIATGNDLASQIMQLVSALSANSQ